MENVVEGLLGRFLCIGILKRGGKVRVEVVKDVRGETLLEMTS